MIVPQRLGRGLFQLLRQSGHVHLRRGNDGRVNQPGRGNLRHQIVLADAGFDQGLGIGIGTSARLWAMPAWRFRISKRRLPTWRPAGGGPRRSPEVVSALSVRRQPRLQPCAARSAISEAPSPEPQESITAINKVERGGRPLSARETWLPALHAALNSTSRPSIQPASPGPAVASIRARSSGGDQEGGSCPGRFQSANSRISRAPFRIDIAGGLVGDQKIRPATRASDGDAADSPTDRVGGGAFHAVGPIPDRDKSSLLRHGVIGDTLATPAQWKRTLSKAAR